MKIIRKNRNLLFKKNQKKPIRKYHSKKKPKKKISFKKVKQKKNII